MKIKRGSFVAIVLAMIFCLVLGGCSSKSAPNTKVSSISKEQSTKTSNENKDKSSTVSTTVNGDLKVSYINVGQADSILIQQNGSNMLIDAGNNVDANTIINYLKAQGVKKLDYVIGTHPHADHIGSMDAVIKTFDIGTVYLPKETSNTKTYKDVLSAIKSKNLKINTPVPGSSFNLGGANCTILAPNSSGYKDINNTSIVVKVTYGDTKFMFDGDAEDVSEKEMIDKGFDVSANVLKLGHHGSHSSSTDAFLNKVFVDKSKPQIAIVSCGVGNDYGHPHIETMQKLKQRGIKVYRTDEAGNILITSDGKNIKCDAKEGSYNSPRK